MYNVLLRTQTLQTYSTSKRVCTKLGLTLTLTELKVRDRHSCFPRVFLIAFLLTHARRTYIHTDVYTRADTCHFSSELDYICGRVTAVDQ